MKANITHSGRDGVGQRAHSSALCFLNLELRSVLDVKYRYFLSGLKELCIFKAEEKRTFLSAPRGEGVADSFQVLGTQGKLPFMYHLCFFFNV